MSSSKISPKIRQVAVLLTSVDGQTARELLGQFPNEEARQIRQAMVHLGSVTVQERRQALDLFQRMTGGSPKNSNTSSRPESPAESLAGSTSDSIDRVEISASAREALSRDSDENSQNHLDSSTSSHNQSDLWHELDVDDLAELLIDERAILIAIVLNQVPVPFASKLLNALPQKVAVDALALLPQLQTTPQDILQELHQHLRKKIADYQLPKRTAEQNLQKLQAILGAASDVLRNDCMKRVGKEMPYVAKRLGWGKADELADNIDNPAMALASKQDESEQVSNPSQSKPISPNAPVEEKVVHASVSHASNDIDQENGPTILPFSNQTNGSSVNGGPTVTMSWEEVTTLELADLAEVLRATEPSVILLALSGASEEMYQRVQSMLHPRDAKRLDAKMASMGAVQLRDIQKAQALIATKATEMLATGKIGSLISMTITAAA